MADSELHMECEEGDTAPWQHATEEDGEEVSKKMEGSERPASEDQTIILTLVRVSPSSQTLVQTHSPPGSMLTPSPLLNQPSLSPLVLTPVSPTTQLTTVPLTNSNSPQHGQPIILSTQSLQAASMGQHNQLGLILNSQPITFLPGGQGAQLQGAQLQGAQLQGAQLGQPSGEGRSVDSVGAVKGLSTVQIPVTLTCHTSLGYQTLSRVGSGVTSLPSTTPALHRGTPIITKVVSVGASDVAPVKVSTLPASSPAQPPLQATSHRSLQPSAPTSSQPLKGGLMGPAKPKLCQHCGGRYKIIHALRGFLCSCSTEIARSLKKLNSPKPSKPAKCNKSTSKRPYASSRDSSSSSSSSSDTSRPHKKKKIIHREPIQKKVLAPTPLTPIKRGRGRPRKTESLGTQGTGEAQAGTPSQGKLIILVEDFYYGTDRSCGPAEEPERQPGGFKCINCDKSIINNIKLMHHMRKHVELSRMNDDVTSNTSCPQCFRHFPTPYRLQSHLESVHGNFQSSSKCKICERAFRSEPVFLQHMKNVHRPGEMPYICQVCRFRSSFYSEVMDHFQKVHSDTSHLLCPYCLRVFRSPVIYQQHYSRHQKKKVFSCHSCRLHFLFAKERAEHKAQHHRTHLKPPQLEGLKPGTKVTIRTYAAGDTIPQVLSPLNQSTAPPQVIEVPPGPQALRSPQKWLPESQVQLLVGFQKHSPVLGRQTCVECTFSIPDFATHFPTYVHCSLCRFRTCCSRSYANHMISNHVTRRSSTKYETLFSSYPRESLMWCTLCRFSSTVGDMMANHLTDHPEHLTCSFSEPGPDLIAASNPAPSSTSSSPVSGSFVPLSLLSSSTGHVSVKPLLPSSILPSPSPPAFTIRLLGSLASIRDGLREDPPEGQDPGKKRSPQGKEVLLKTVAKSKPSSSSLPLHKPLTVHQLSVLLSALCQGLPQASQCHRVRPSSIQAWARHQDRLRLLEEWRWCSDRIAEWVLTQREQQLPLSEDSLLQTASEALDEARDISSLYRWAVNFMLRHSLCLHASLAPASRPPLPRNVFESTRIFTRFVARQVRGQRLKPCDTAALDELSLFVDEGGLAEGSPDALQVFGEGEAALDLLLSARADGTLLSPLLFLRGKLPTPMSPPGSVLVWARPEGFSDAERLEVWLSKVWNQQDRRSPPQEGKGLLVMDTHRGHLATDFLSALSCTSTIPAIIPIGCSSRLQPLEVCVGPVFREFLQARWRRLVAKGGGAELGGLGGLALKVAGWLGELVSCLEERPRILARSFSIVCTPPHDEDEYEAADVTRVLTEVLIGSLGEEDEEEMEDEDEDEEDEEYDEQDEEDQKNSSADEPKERGRGESVQDKQEVMVSEEGGRGVSCCESPSPQRDLLSIRQMFERESDLESFHGFEEKEVTSYMKTRSSRKNKL